MKKYSLLLSTLLTLTSSLMAQDAESIFDAKCAMCHMKSKPADKSQVVAPAVMGVMRHMKMTYPDRTQAINFIKDYVINPSQSKAICMPQKIRRFGLMPSQKGNITEAELEQVAGWMFDNFPNKTAQAKQGCQAKSVQKPKIKKPFLIKSNKLPHFVGLIQKVWDNPEFALTPTQKEQLTTLKQATLFDVKRLSKEINPLIQKIATLTNEGVEIDKIMILVNKIATLKTSATKVHLACIQKTRKILTADQLNKILMLAQKGQHGK